MDTISKNQMKLMRMLIVVMAAAVMLILVPAGRSYATDDPVTHTFLLQADSPSALDPVFGQAFTDADPQITDPSGEAQYIDGTWQYMSMNDWHESAADQFFAGTWRYYIRIGLESEQYDFFDDEFIVKVDGVQWETIIYQDDETYEHFLAAAIPDPYRMIEAEDGGDLIFVDSPDFDIPKSYPGEYIWPFSVANYVSGGTSPYTFSKTSGPDWITVDAESGEVSGAPETEGDNGLLEITVEDSVGARKSITIEVAETGHDMIETVKAYGYVPSLFEDLDSFFTVFVGEPAEFITDEGHWEKKNGDVWEEVSTGSFSAGTWRYTCPLRISGMVGQLCQLSQDAEVIVSGDYWDTSDYVYDPDEHLSQLTVTSPVYEFDNIDITNYEKVTISVKNSVEYTGEPVTTLINAVYHYGSEEFPESRTLAEGTDYTVEYSDNTNVGTAYVKITGKDTFTGEVTKQFQITQKSLAGASVDISDQAYTGQAVEPVPAVTLDGVTLTAGTDFDVSYDNNVEVGDATCKITGKGNYTGEASASFRITEGSSDDKTKELEGRITELEEELKKLQAANAEQTEKYRKLKIKYDTLRMKNTAVKGVKVKFSKRKAVVTYKSLGKGYTYRVFYSLKKNGKYKALGKKAVSKTKVTTVKLKRGKKYFFKVRAYKKINGKKVAGKFSKIIKKKCI